VRAGSGARDRFSTAGQDKLGAAAAALAPEVIRSLQKTIHSKVTGFVTDKQADYKMIEQAIREAGTEPGAAPAPCKAPGAAYTAKCSEARE
jgi:hypothetical protein